MNYYGFEITSSDHKHLHIEYLVIAESLKVATKLIQKEADRLASDEVNGWAWGIPNISAIPDARKMKHASLIWQ